jgi:hypothetical protein
MILVSFCSETPDNCSSDNLKLYVGTILCLSTVEVEVTLRLTVNMSWYRAPLWNLRPDDQTLLPVGMLLSEICGLVSVGRSL